MKVMRRWSVKTVDVRSDATGLSSRAGTSLLTLVADRVGLTDGLCEALAGTRERRGRHVPGRVVCDLAVMVSLTAGGACLIWWRWRASPRCLARWLRCRRRGGWCCQSASPSAGIRTARAAARARAWAAGATPEQVILDFDATPLVVHSEKEQAAGPYKGGFGFNPLLVSCGRDVLAGILRPGNTGANNAEDHIELLDLALGQLPQSAATFSTFHAPYAGKFLGLHIQALNRFHGLRRDIRSSAPPLPARRRASNDAAGFA